MAKIKREPDANDELVCKGRKGCGKKLHKDNFKERTYNITGGSHWSSLCTDCIKANDRYRKAIAAGKNPTIVDTVENTVDGEEVVDYDISLELLAKALLNYVAYEVKMVNMIDECVFWAALNLEDDILATLDYKYKDIQAEAHRILHHEHGESYEKGLELGAGRYMIVGDSHGKNTPHRMFDMLARANEEFDIDKIIHLGHILDYNNFLSYRWYDFDNLLVVSKREEIKTIVSILKEVNQSLDIVRDEIRLGNLLVRNQDLVTNEYIKGGIDRLDPKIFTESMVTNLHKHEMLSITSDRGINRVYMSPGCLCEPHRKESIKQLDVIGTGGRRVLVNTHPDSHQVYRRQTEMSQYWEQGAMIVEVSESGEYTVYPMRIYDLDEDNKACVYMEKVVTSSEVDTVDTLNLVTGDAHAPMVDHEVSAIIDLVADDYNFDAHINLGDAVHNGALNHHDMDKGKVVNYINACFLDEMQQAEWYLGMTTGWSSRNYYIYANHERFVRDFTDKYPQLTNALDLRTLLRFDEHGIKMIDHKETFILDGARFMHGDLMCFGAAGKPGNKFSSVYDARLYPIMYGHVHYPSIYSGAYSIGLAGKVDQGYNEDNASRWMNGFGMSASYKGVTWNTTLAITCDKFLMLNGINYGDLLTDDDVGCWCPPDRTMKVDYYNS